MILTGVLVNAAAIVVCAITGAFLIKGVPDRFHETLSKGVGLCILFIGISGTLDNENVMLLIVSIVVGSLVGEWLNLDGGMNRLGDYAEKGLGFGEGVFSRGFVSASVLFCTGSMAIIGSFNSGLLFDHEMLYAKAILDGVISAVFASTMGIGVAFSALPVLIYEGVMTLGAAFFRDYLTEEMIREMSAVGSLIIAGIGLNFLEIKNIRVANMIPAVFIPCIYYGFLEIIG